MNVKCCGPDTVSHRLMLLQAGPSVCTEKCFAYFTTIKQVREKMESPRVWVNESFQFYRDVLTTPIIKPMMNTSCSRLIDSSGPRSLLAEHNQYHISVLSSFTVQEVTFFFIFLRGLVRYVTTRNPSLSLFCVCLQSTSCQRRTTLYWLTVLMKRSSINQIMETPLPLSSLR